LAEWPVEYGLGPGVNLNGTYKKGKFGFSDMWIWVHQQTNGIEDNSIFLRNSSLIRTVQLNLHTHTMEMQIEL
jgi:hypothetical protein